MQKNANVKVDIVHPPPLEADETENNEETSDESNKKKTKKPKWLWQPLKQEKQTEILKEPLFEVLLEHL